MVNKQQLETIDDQNGNHGYATNLICAIRLLAHCSFHCSRCLFWLYTTGCCTQWRIQEILKGGAVHGTKTSIDVIRDTFSNIVYYHVSKFTLFIECYDLWQQTYFRNKYK
jgi:MoaA/NifB/PqqE/SkfB family radical SAM enzyme